MAIQGFFLLQETHHLLPLLAFMALSIAIAFSTVSPSPLHSNSTHNATSYFRSPPHSIYTRHNSTPNHRPSPPPPNSTSSHNSTAYFPPPPPPPPVASPVHPPPNSMSSHNSTPYSRPPPPAVASPAPPPQHSTSRDNSTPHFRTRPTAWPDHPRFIDDVIEALIRSGNFSRIGMLLSAAVAATPSLISLALPVPAATLFIPSNAAMAHLPARFDPFVIPYHIIPGPPLSFSDLRRLGLRARLPTLLPSNSIVITNNTAANFTIDDSQIVRPDLFHNAAVSVHGINNILDYSMYGTGALRILSQPINQNFPHLLDCSGSDSDRHLHPAAAFYLFILCYLFIHIFA